MSSSRSGPWTADLASVRSARSSSPAVGHRPCSRGYYGQPSRVQEGDCPQKLSTTARSEAQDHSEHGQLHLQELARRRRKVPESEYKDGLDGLK